MNEISEALLGAITARAKATQSDAVEFVVELKISAALDRGQRAWFATINGPNDFRAGAKIVQGKEHMHSDLRLVLGVLAEAYSVRHEPAPVGHRLAWSDELDSWVDEQQAEDEAAR